LEIIASNFDSKIRVNYLNIIEEEIMHSDLCIEKALKTGWKPKISLEMGIRELISKAVNENLGTRNS
jgi:nucleoside-diphosphate-sugar epimerase